MPEFVYPSKFFYSYFEKGIMLISFRTILMNELPERIRKDEIANKEIQKCANEC